MYNKFFLGSTPFIARAHHVNVNVCVCASSYMKTSMPRIKVVRMFIAS